MVSGDEVTVKQMVASVLTEFNGESTENNPNQQQVAGGKSQPPHIEMTTPESLTEVEFSITEPVILASQVSYKNKNKQEETDSNSHSTSNRNTKTSKSPQAWIAPFQSKSPFYRGLLWGSAFTLTAAISAIVGASLALVSPLSPILTPVKEPNFSFWQDQNQDSWGSLLQYRLARPVNILVMGIDRVPDAPQNSAEAFAGRSDTMLLVRFDPRDKSLRMLSIPRDSRVEIPGVGLRKINDANVEGGPALAARVVSKTLNNIEIDRYVRVTTDAFIEMVDLVGGIEVYVPQRMSYVDRTQNLTIDLEQGWQTLNGDQAEQFARFRQDRYGDIGRVQRQQILLKALRQRLQNPAILPRLPQAIRLFQQYVDTNLSVEEMLALANFGKDLDHEHFQMIMLPGRFSQKQEYDASYWLIAEAKKNQVMQEYFGIIPEFQTELAPNSRTQLNEVRIAIQNTTNEPELGRRVAEYLREQDFQNVYVAQDTAPSLRQTEIIVQQGDMEAAETLKRVMGTGRVEISSTGDLDSDLTIRIGKDWLYKDF